MEHYKKVLARLEEIEGNEGVALKCDGLDEAIVDICSRFGRQPLLAYSIPKVIGILMKRDWMSEEEAQEFFDFNIIGAYVGEGTPVFLEGIGE